MRKLGSEDEGLILMITLKAADLHKRSELLGLHGKKTDLLLWREKVTRQGSNEKHVEHQSLHIYGDRCNISAP